MKRSLVNAVLVCAALAACDGTTAPPVPSDVFTLLAPVVVIDDEVVRTEILEETLSFFEGGRAVREYEARWDYVSPQVRDTTVAVSEDYAYEVSGNTIEFAADCNDVVALCVAPPHIWGRVTSTGLELRAHFAPDVVLRYQRVP